MHAGEVTAAGSRPDHPGNAELQALRQRLLRHARHTMASAASAEDLVQDTLMVVVVAAGTRRGDASLQTWAMGVLKHKIADWYRAPARRLMVNLDADDDTLARTVDAEFDAEGRWAEPVPRWTHPDQQEERRQLARSLDECLGDLPTQTGRVFFMREWLGFETSEISERLGLSPENIRQMLHRARMGLRLCLQKHGQQLGAGA